MDLFEDASESLVNMDLVPDSNSYKVDSEPLIEVSSVRIYPNDENQPYDIYGEIYIYDGKQENNHIYKRNRGNPQTITSGNSSLLLTGPSNGVIYMDSETVMAIKLQLKGENEDKSRDVWFARGRVNLDTKTEFCYEEIKSLTFKGDLGVVRVDYFVVPCGVIAEMRVKVVREGEENDDEDDDEDDESGHHDADISGSITACYGKTYGDVSDCPSIILYKKLSDECDQMAYGVPLQLCRSIVCVPSYSSLSIKLNLALKGYSGAPVDQIIVSGLKEFKTGGYEIREKYSSSSREVGVIVILRWFTSDAREYILKISQVTPGLEKEENRRSSQLHFHRQTVSTISLRRCISPKDSILGRFRIELFSVFVGNEKKERVDDLCGTIAVETLMGVFYVFQRDKIHSDNLSLSRRAVSLEGLASYPSDWFFMCVKLKDANGHTVINNGLSLYYFSYYIPRQWFNRPLCTVLPGKHNYFAAVHYILLENSVKATVKVYVIAKYSDSLPFVRGTVFAQYSNSQYSTSYEKKYCRSVLFERNDARQVIENGQVLLSRDVVSVPMGSSLVLDVNLHASVNSNGALVDSAEHLVGDVELEIGDVGCKQLKGLNYEVMFMAAWENGCSK